MPFRCSGMIGLGSIPGAERDIVRVRKWARLSAVGWPPQGLAGRVFVRGIVLVCAPLDVHGWRGRVRVTLPRYGSLAQWMERPVTSREAAGSSPARPTGSMVYGSALLSFVACCGVCYGVGACCRLAREPVGALLCSHSSQSSSGTGWVYSARGGTGRRAGLRVRYPVCWGVWVRVPLGALAGLSGVALRKLNTLMCPWWNW